MRVARLVTVTERHASVVAIAACPVLTASVISSTEGQASAPTVVSAVALPTAVVRTAVSWAPVVAIAWAFEATGRAAVAGMVVSVEGAPLVVPTPRLRVASAVSSVATALVVITVPAVGGRARRCTGSAVVSGAALLGTCAKSGKIRR